MPIRNQNWYNLQATRRYPLDDISTGVDDHGAFIRDDIIVDCHVRFPNNIGTYLYVQGITVSSGLVTVVFGAATHINAATGTTVAAITIPKPVMPYMHYNVQGIVPGVSGWVVFGPGITEHFVGRYTTPKQTLIQPRSARAYRPLPIPTLGKLNLATALEGVISLLGSAPVTATYELIDANNDGTPDSPAIVFRLSNLDITADYNPLKDFLGPCGQRPESGTCDKTPIESINGLTPDCAGNIEIDFGEFAARSFMECGGIDIVSDVSLAAVCESNKPKPPQAYNDLCCELTGETVLTYDTRNNFPASGEPEKLYRAYDTNTLYRWENGAYTETDIVLDEYCWTDPTQAIDEVIDETLPSATDLCLNLPLCVDFLNCEPGYYFSTVAGLFSGRNTDAPPGCENCNDAAFVPNVDVGPLSNHGTYASTGIGGLNIALLRNCATDWALGRAMTTQFKIGTNGVARNGGLVLNYTQTLELNQVVTRYIAVVVDSTRARVRVLRYTNDTFVEETSANYSAKTNTWYQLSATLNLNGAALTVNFSVEELDGTNTLSGFTSIPSPADVTGAAGLFANQSYTFFNKFTVV